MIDCDHGHLSVMVLLIYASTSYGTEGRDTPS